MPSAFDAIFKAYDVRGIYPNEVNEKVAERIGQAYAAVRKPKKVAVGRDVRAHGEILKKALIKGLVDRGVDVLDIDVITTDQLYFAVGQYGLDGGISVTASHNPGEYNGFKFAIAGGAPPSSEDLVNMRDWAASANQPAKTEPGKILTQPILDDYISHVLSYIDKDSIRPMKLVVNANFGAVGRSVDIIAQKLNLTLERLNWQEDGSFPKGPPNPLLPENRDETVQKIKEAAPDFAIAWDADADRVFFFTGEAEFVPSCYIIALLAREFAAHQPGSKIIHDLTTSWVINDMVKAAGGQSISNRTGHTFIKARMRQEDAVFAGENSGHYYFKDSFSADNGIVPFLMLLEMISKSKKSLKDLVDPLMKQYKVSGEINFTVADPTRAIELVEQQLGPEGKIDKTDGIVVDSGKWRFSARPSNTEPLFRLNAEAKSQAELDMLVAKITKIITSNTTS